MRAAAIAIAFGVAISAPAAASAQVPQVIRFDGGAYDRAGAIATDAAGNGYVAGSVEATGAASPFAVVKLGPDGTPRWTARYDGSRGGVGGEARAVTLDAAGNVYAAGYVHDGVIFNQNYDYLVVKFGPDGAQRWARAGAAPALLAPSQLDATALSSSQIRLRWQDNAGTEDGFRIERCLGIGCTGFSQVAAVGHDVTSYVDSGLARNTAYSYRVRAFNAGGVSAYSNTATAKTRRK